MGIARNIARLVPNGSGELPTANLQNSAVTKAKQAADAYTVIKTRQYVFNTYSTVTSGANSWTDLGVYADITPTYSNSIIKVEFIMPLSFGNQMNNAMRVVRRIGAGSFTLPATTTATAISNRMQGHSLSFWGFGDNWSRNINHVMTFYDNPGTTSQCTYRAEMNGSGSTTVRLGYNYDTSSGTNDYSVAPQIVILTEYAAGIVETVDAV
jgi:hypothetical protein